MKVTPHHGGLPYVTPDPAYQSASAAYESTFGIAVAGEKRWFYPIVALFEQILGAKSILMGFD